MSRPSKRLLHAVRVGGGRSPWGDLLGVVCAAVALFVGAGFVALARRGQLWLPDEVRALLAGEAGDWVALATPACVLGAHGLLRHRRRRRAGVVELYTDWVTFKKVAVDGPHRVESAFLRWSSLEGYRDRATDHVLLIPGPGASAPFDLAIPTPTEADRVTILRILDQAGLSRLDA